MLSDLSGKIAATMSTGNGHNPPPPKDERPHPEPQAFVTCPECKRADVLVHIDGRYQTHHASNATQRPCKLSGKKMAKTEVERVDDASGLIAFKHPPKPCGCDKPCDHPEGRFSDWPSISEELVDLRGKRTLLVTEVKPDDQLGRNVVGMMSDAAGMHLYSCSVETLLAIWKRRSV